MSKQPLDPSRWPLGFCDCFTYKDPVTHDCQWCPYFVPMGVCGTCFVVGRIRTLYVNETVQCCDMGTQGLALCCISTPINIAGPLGGFCWFAINSAKMRHDVVKHYGLDDSKAGTCCCFNIPTCCIGVCYPCSLFQILMTLRQFKNEGKLSAIEGSDKQDKQPYAGNAPSTTYAATGAL